MKRRLSILLIGVLTSVDAYSYELATHARLTETAYTKSVLGDTQFLKAYGIDATDPEPFGIVYYDVSGAEVKERQRDAFERKFMPDSTLPLSVQGWLLRGAIREDDWTGIDVPGCQLHAENPQDDKLNRPGNHFYDPIYDRPLTVAFGLGEKAPNWGLGTLNFPANPPPPDAARRNHCTVLDAREAMYRALTGKRNGNTDVATTKDERNKYWATTFRALGDVVHLVEDMGQPQHTRNDAHSGVRGFGHACIYSTAHRAPVANDYHLRSLT